MPKMAEGGFDPQDFGSYFRGKLTRQETNNILNQEDANGIFLVRDSANQPGNYVLCVKEDLKISHYIINKISNQHGTPGVQYKIGDQTFPDIPALLQFYQVHYLDSTPLIKPAAEKVQGQYDFAGNDQEDLPFGKGDILTVVTKDEDQWWTCRNAEGREGLTPVPYIKPYIPGSSQLPPRQLPRPEKPPFNSGLQWPMVGVQHHGNPLLPPPATSVQRPRKLPALARVIMQRIPNAYDKTALKMEVGETVTVISDSISGTWEGELNGRRGFFPFNYVKFLEDQREEDG